MRKGASSRPAYALAACFTRISVVCIKLLVSTANVIRSLSVKRTRPEAWLSDAQFRLNVFVLRINSVVSYRVYLLNKYLHSNRTDCVALIECKTVTATLLTRVHTRSNHFIERHFYIIYLIIYLLIYI